MNKVIDITKIITKTETETEEKQPQKNNEQKATNPIFKKLAQFKNTQLSKKFNINDLLR